MSLTKGHTAKDLGGGEYNGNNLPVASYYYVIEYNDNTTENKTGVVSLIK